MSLRSPAITRVDENYPRYYVQGETVRGEPRIYWIVDRTDRYRFVCARSRNQKRLEAKCERLNAEERAKAASVIKFEDAK